MLILRRWRIWKKNRHGFSWHLIRGCRKALPFCWRQKVLVGFFSMLISSLALFSWIISCYTSWYIVWIILEKKRNFFCRFDAENVYAEMFRKNAEKKFQDDKFPDKSPKDWFLFRNFKMELYGKEVWIIWIFFKNIIINGGYFYIISLYFVATKKLFCPCRFCLEKWK